MSEVDQTKYDPIFLDYEKLLAQRDAERLRVAEREADDGTRLPEVRVTEVTAF